MAKFTCSCNSTVGNWSKEEFAWGLTRLKPETVIEFVKYCSDNKKIPNKTMLDQFLIVVKDTRLDYPKDLNDRNGQ